VYWAAIDYKAVQIRECRCIQNNLVIRTVENSPEMSWMIWKKLGKKYKFKEKLKTYSVWIMELLSCWTKCV